LRDLRGFTRTGLTHKHDDLVLSQKSHEVGAVLENWQLNALLEEIVVVRRVECSIERVDAA
jgi:hypothetical protein